MNFLKDIRLIQGGMGVFISSWGLARAVSKERPGLTAGTVSGTALDTVHVRLLQLGDAGGHLRRALAAFDALTGGDSGQKILKRYFIEGGKGTGDRFKAAPIHTVHPPAAKIPLPVPGTPPEPIPLEMDREAIEMLVATTFAEVWLAKESHTGRIFINFLKKVELPLIFSMFGAMLAGVDGIVVGAGNPDGLADTCMRLARFETVEMDVAVLYREAGENFRIQFDPRSIFAGKLPEVPLQRPAFLAIASLHGLAEALATSPSQAPDGFIIEHHTAGGHNAAPQGPLVKDAFGQPVYGPEDEPDLERIRQTGIPFWLAGGYSSATRLQQALARGASGVQVGSTFALAEESGMKLPYRTAILNAIREGKTDGDLIRTTFHSPTGYPFKVVQLEGTLAEEGIYSSRKRICDIGYLQQRGLGKPDEEGKRLFFQRCPAAPVDDFIHKRGLPPNTLGKRCLCNGLLATTGLGQRFQQNGSMIEEPAIVTLGNALDGIRRLSQNGQTSFTAKNVVDDILGSA